MTAFLDLFSGIGGFALAAYWSNLRFDKHYFSEVNDYAIKLYQKRFPEAIPLGDIKNVDYSKLEKGEWLVTGGFPCQPHSIAGKRKGSEDERDLWSECRRMLCVLRPRIALFENVPALFNTDGGKFINRVISDIIEAGYDAEWQNISAWEIGAKHKRERVWIIAYTNSMRELQSQGSEQDFGRRSRNLCEEIPDTENNRIIERKRKLRSDKQALSKRIDNRRGKTLDEIGEWWKSEPNVGRLAYGVPFRMDRIRGNGNAIVPQCAEVIFNLPAFDYWRKGETE